jgi:hypothetical protein
VDVVNNNPAANPAGTALGEISEPTKHKKLRKNIWMIVRSTSGKMKIQAFGAGPVYSEEKIPLQRCPERPK